MRTRKQRQGSGTRKLGGGTLPRYASTYDGLFHWYNKMLEKLGWMIMAKAKGRKEKISHYKKSIQHFLKTADHLQQEYYNHNRQHDLKVLIMNVKELQAFVNKHF